MKLIRKIDSIIHWIGIQYNSYIYNPWLFRLMRKKADNLHKIHGYQFHVMPLTKGKLIIMSKSYHKPGECVSIKFYNALMKKHHGRPLDIIAVLKMSYYSTPVKR